MCLEFMGREDLIVIGSFPSSTAQDRQVVAGVPAYMSELCNNLIPRFRAHGGRLIVLADRLVGSPAFSQQGGALIWRCWTRNSPAVFLDLVAGIRRFPDTRQVLIQFEFNLFGDAAVTAMFPIFLGILRLMGKRAYVLIHQVVEDLSELCAHVGLHKGSLRFALYRRFLPLFYHATAQAAHKVATHDDALRQRLERITHLPAAVVPHGCSCGKVAVERKTARAALGLSEQDKILLCFGFLTHYKGSDWITQEMAEYVKANPDARVRLILAGGKSPNHCGRAYYESYYAALEGLVGRCCGKILMTGYVPDSLIATYFGAADVAVFPYRTHMSSSGPLAVALSFGSPFFLSEALCEMAADDLARSLSRHGLTVNDISFPLHAGGFLPRLLALLDNPRKLELLREASAELGNARAWNIAAEAYRRFLGREPRKVVLAATDNNLAGTARPNWVA